MDDKTYYRMFIKPVWGRREVFMRHNGLVPYQEATMKRKAPPVAKDKVGKVMGEFKAGKLRSSSGQKVAKRKQAVAIGLSEKRREQRLKGQPL